MKILFIFHNIHLGGKESYVRYELGVAHRFTTAHSPSKTMTFFFPVYFLVYPTTLAFLPPHPVYSHLS